MLYISKGKGFFIFCVVAVGIIFAIPSFLNQNNFNNLPTWLQKKVNLGLDLQGGSHLLLDVDVDSAITEHLSFMADDFRRLLNKNSINFTKMTTIAKGANSIINFQIDNADDKEKVFKLLQQEELQIDYQNNDKKFSISLTRASIKTRSSRILAQSKEIIEKRINALGTKEPTIQTQGDKQIIVQLPGISDPAQVTKILGTTAKLTFQLVHPKYTTINDSGGIIVPGTIAIPQSGKEKLVYLVKKKVLLTGEHLIDAQANFKHDTNEPIVNIKFDSIGARKFGMLTSQYTHNLLAMVLDGKVLSAPVLREPIMGGSALISGTFTVAEAYELALLLRSGSLPAPINVIEERTVGPDLGSDSIIAGKHATLFSIVLILIVMIMLYSLFGGFASIALLGNLLFLITLLAMTGSTLTLPGIAGIALTLGMAVDANILIFERIKEELRLGSPIINAIASGYKRAMTTILDSNITTLIGALALFFFGSGPIKGFGVTLCFGIIISMFTAITLSRFLVVIWLKIFKPQKLPI